MSLQLPSIAMPTHPQQKQLEFRKSTYLAGRRRKGAARGLRESLPGSEHCDCDWREETTGFELDLVVGMAKGKLRSEVLLELPQR
jgi:hypothetical protein